MNRRRRTGLPAIFVTLWVATMTIAVAGGSLCADDRPRLLVLTEIGGDPDDQQSMIRLMTYSNEFEIEGLIASASGTPGELKKAVTQPDLIRKIVSAHGQVRPNLVKHAEGWPETETLLSRIKSGSRKRCPEKGVTSRKRCHVQKKVSRPEKGGPEKGVKQKKVPEQKKVSRSRKRCQGAEKGVKEQKKVSRTVIREYAVLRHCVKGCLPFGDDQWLE